MRLALRRIVAWMIDWACILGWIAVTAAIGVPLSLAGVIHLTDPLAQNVVAALVVIVPPVLAETWFESRGGATPGKRVLHLQVRRGVIAPSFRRALVRNAVKIGLPWLIAHAAVFVVIDASLAGRPTTSAIWVILLAAYVLPVVWIVSLFVGAGRTPYDRIAGTTVV